MCRWLDSTQKLQNVPKTYVISADRQLLESIFCRFPSLALQLLPGFGKVPRGPAFSSSYLLSYSTLTYHNICARRPFHCAKSLRNRVLSFVQSLPRSLRSSPEQRGRNSHMGKAGGQNAGHTYEEMGSAWKALQKHLIEAAGSSFSTQSAEGTTT